MGNTVSIELIGNAGRLLREFDVARRGAQKFGSAVKNEFRALKDAATSLNGKLAGLGISLGLIEATRQSAFLDKKLTQIGQTAGESKKAVGGLRGEIFGMAKDSGQQIDGLSDGFNNLIQAGQSWRSSLESTKAINIASAVTGAGSDILAGGLSVGAEAYQIDLEKPGKALELLDKMTVAGRKGNAELENLSQIFARVGVNSASAGMGFEKTLAFLETLSLAEKEPSRLGTLADSTTRLFTNLNYMKTAQKNSKVKFFDNDGSRRDPVAVLKDIKAKYDALKTDFEQTKFLGKTFEGMDQDTIKGIRSLFQGDKLGKVEEFQAAIEAAGGTLKRDIEDATDNLIDQTGRMKATLREGFDAMVKPMKDTLKDLIKYSLNSKEKGGLGLSGKQLIAGGVGLGVGGLLLGRYGGKMLGSLAKSAGGATAGIAAGMAVQAATGVTPVFVTNWPSGGMGGGLPGVAETAAGPGLLKKMGAAAKGGWEKLALLGDAGLSKVGVKFGLQGAGTALTGGLGAGTAVGSAGLLALAGGAGYGVGSAINKYLIDGTAVGDAIGESLNRVFAFFGNEASKQAIQINMQIDENGRVMTESSDPNTEVNPKLRRGKFTE